LTGPVGQPPLDTQPPDAAATVEDVRASRRWTWVALAWAIAASAIAVIALINASDESNGTTTTTSTGAGQSAQIEKFVSDTNERLDAFSRRLNDKAAQTDVDKLDKRLSQVEDDLSQAKDDNSQQAKDIKQAQTDLKDLQQRVDELESQQQAQGTGTTTTP
jgi:peptidoglycan hydrolase CwlO-like protein